MLVGVALLAQPALPWSVAVDPVAPGVTPRWTLELSAPYCGGFRIGDGVYVHPEPPLNLPEAVADGSVLFQRQPASVSLTADALMIGPGPGTVFSQVCAPGESQFTIELMPEAGLALPAEPGTYAIDIWTGAEPSQVVTLTFDVPPAEP